MQIECMINVQHCVVYLIALFVYGLIIDKYLMEVQGGVHASLDKFDHAVVHASLWVWSSSSSTMLATQERRSAQQSRNAKNFYFSTNRQGNNNQ